MQYFLTYNLGWQAPANKKANLGSIAHKVLEILANFKLIIQNNPKKKKYEYIDDETGTFNFTKDSIWELGVVDDIIERCYKHYTESTPDIHYIPSDYKFCKTMVDTCLEFNNGQFDPRRQEIVSPEKSFDLPIDEPWARIEHNGEIKQLRIKGTMDLITSVGPDTLEYVDYKTGQRKNWATDEEKTYAKLHDDIQLLLYYYAISKLYPEYPHIIMTIFFLRDGGPFSLCFDKSDEKKFLKMLEKKFVEIKNCTLPKPINKWRSGFKCEKLCHYYKNNWPGTDTTMCHHVENTIKTYGIDVAVEKLSKPGFTVDFYSAPGATNKEKTDDDAGKT